MDFAMLLLYILYKKLLLKLSGNFNDSLMGLERVESVLKTKFLEAIAILQLLQGQDVIRLD